MNTEKKLITAETLKNFLTINLGIFILAIGIHVFKNPNKFALGGISGLSIIASYFFPNQPIGIIMMFINVFVLLMSFLFLGKEATVKSVYGSIALSFFVWIMEIAMPIESPMTNQKLLELLYGVFLPGIGTAIVFFSGATTGGTDIIAKIIHKYFKIRISLSLLISDIFIALTAGLLFGMEACLFSILGVCLKSFVLDTFLESLQVFKIMTIISTKSEEIKEFILIELHRGATTHEARGAFGDKTKKEVITTVLNRWQAAKLRDYIHKIDPQAFITITNSYQIIGRGFNLSN
ncbi:YitT family protein [Anaeropeptidivorans aminofermentans]|jgi:uncharacterized membrane-anchored protein YitT (DUF2179 family)|uniref:YitT family protein n=1 Tax=Anaeropeptidivorans aminofermentans TaxID=2934315 RepID=UPI002023F4B8|nr:YitT family protein [Anaeropeptidivorans aminofermentans]